MYFSDKKEINNIACMVDDTHSHMSRQESSNRSSLLMVTKDIIRGKKMRQCVQQWSISPIHASKALSLVFHWWSTGKKAKIGLWTCAVCALCPCNPVWCIGGDTSIGVHTNTYTHMILSSCIWSGQCIPESSVAGQALMVSWSWSWGIDSALVQFTFSLCPCNPVNL